MKRTVFILLMLLTAAPSFAQYRPEVIDSIMEAEYRQRIKKAYLNGIYIPKDFKDALRNLNRLTSPEAKQKFKAMPESIVYRKLFFSFGRWITFKWGLREGSRLSASLKKMGLSHPEDMAELLIISFHRKLNKRPLETQALIQSIAEKRKKINSKRFKKTIITTHKPRKSNP